MLRTSVLIPALLAVAIGVTSPPMFAAGESTPRIDVAGEGVASVAPDMATVSLTVTREAQTAREALSASNEAMENVLAAMRKRGIEEKDLQTSDFNIQPRYTQPVRTPAGVRPAPRIEGYTVRNGLTVTVRDLAELGAIIDQSVGLGVNEGGSVRFANADPSKTIDRARVKAVADALARARVLADAAGISTGRILSLSEQFSLPRPAPMLRASAFAEADASVPMATGENSYRVTVQLSVAIEQ